ncbi:MAG: formimidoylglutamate deiminase [Parvularculaceae bacterium]
MTEIFAKRARLRDGWARDVVIKLDRGRIASVSKDSRGEPGAIYVDTLLPAIANLHSHSFQRAMAGMTEYRTAGRDSFWTWRSLMYRFAEDLTPEDVEAIAALAFVEMLEAGFTSVAEFHYLHHQKGGAPYAAIDELCQRIMAAAESTGIGLTLLPVLYTYSGAGKTPLEEQQLRFGNGSERYLKLVEAARKNAARHEDVKVGVAPHSLRAVAPEDLTRIVAANGEGPIHIHIAEQPQEVEDVKAQFGARPVEWLLANQPVDRRWCLIHATHMTDEETFAAAKSGAVAGLCPITEANLGDGVFNGSIYLNAGGAFGVGSDSNVRISMNEELRTLEYSQRLRDQSRSVLAADRHGAGETLYLRAAAGGAQALERDTGAIEAGRLADLVAVNSQTPALSALGDERLLDGLLFAAGEGAITDVWSAGRHVVKGGRHPIRETVLADYRKAVQRLVDGA